MRTPTRPVISTAAVVTLVATTLLAAPASATESVSKCSAWRTVQIGLIARTCVKVEQEDIYTEGWLQVRNTGSVTVHKRGRVIMELVNEGVKHASSDSAFIAPGETIILEKRTWQAASYPAGTVKVRGIIRNAQGEKRGTRVRISYDF